MNVLFEPLNIGRREIKHRITKTATFETRGTVEGFVTDYYLDYYRAFVKGGVSLIHTGIVYAQKSGRTAPNQVGLDSDDKIPGFRRLAKIAHDDDCLVIAQLHHPGRNLIPTPGYTAKSDVVAPSPVRHLVTTIKPRELTIAEIEELIASWAEAARRAEEAGMDGVQVHVAHGYLLHSFVSGRTNERKDVYGGDGRLKVVEDVIAAIRKKTGSKFLVTLKLSGSDGLPPGGLTPQSSAEIAGRLASLDIDALELSRGTYEFPSTTRGKFPLYLGVTEGSGKYLPWFIKAVAVPLAPILDVILAYKEGFNQDVARAMKAKINKPLITLGGFKSAEKMAEVIEKGEGDAIGVGRQLVRDPELVNKIRKGQTPIECNFCNKCIILAGSKPAMCYEENDRRKFNPPTVGAITA